MFSKGSAPQEKHGQYQEMFDYFLIWYKTLKCDKDANFWIRSVQRLVVFFEPLLVVFGLI
jgi:hypothetical protein